MTAGRRFRPESDSAVLVGVGRIVFRLKSDSVVPAGWGACVFRRKSAFVVLVGVGGIVFRRKSAFAVLVGAGRIVFRRKSVFAVPAGSGACVFRRKSDSVVLVGVDRIVFRRKSASAVPAGSGACVCRPKSDSAVPRPPANSRAGPGGRHCHHPRRDFRLTPSILRRDRGSELLSGNRADARGYPGRPHRRAVRLAGHAGGRSAVDGGSVSAARREVRTRDGDGPPGC